MCAIRDDVWAEGAATRSPSEGDGKGSGVQGRRAAMPSDSPILPTPACTSQVLERKLEMQEADSPCPQPSSSGTGNCSLGDSRQKPQEMLCPGHPASTHYLVHSHFPQVPPLHPLCTPGLQLRVPPLSIVEKFLWQEDAHLQKAALQSIQTGLCTVQGLSNRALSLPPGPTLLLTPPGALSLNFPIFLSDRSPEQTGRQELTSQPIPGTLIRVG